MLCALTLALPPLSEVLDADANGTPAAIYVLKANLNTLGTGLN
jgi:hypothetical protein